MDKKSFKEVFRGIILEDKLDMYFDDVDVNAGDEEEDGDLGFGDGLKDIAYGLVIIDESHPV